METIVNNPSKRVRDIIGELSIALSWSLLIIVGVILGGSGPKGYWFPIAVVIGIITVYILGRRNGFFSWRTFQFVRMLITALLFAYLFFLSILAIRDERVAISLLVSLTAYVLAFNTYSVLRSKGEKGRA